MEHPVYTSLRSERFFSFSQRGTRVRFSRKKEEEEFFLESLDRWNREGCARSRPVARNKLQLNGRGGPVFSGATLEDFADTRPDPFGGWRGEGGGPHNVSD